MSENSILSDPVAWIIPGQFHVRIDGSLDAWSRKQGNYTRPLCDASKVDELARALTIARNWLDVQHREMPQAHELTAQIIAINKVLHGIENNTEHTN